MKCVKKYGFSFFFMIFSFFVFSQTNYFKSSEAYETSSAGAKTAIAGFAEQNFRRGVQSYYRGSFNDAIVEFEKALSYLPSENLILDWLGKAYYRSGIEGAALQQWQFASDSGYGGLLLKNRIEIVHSRRITDKNYSDDAHYTESGTFSGTRGDVFIFSKPFSLLPNSDGTFWVTAYGSNEILKIDINGFIVNRIPGPPNGFDRPTDILRLSNGNLLVCESAGDRLTEISENGIFVKYFGQKGRAIGQMLGPQFMTFSADKKIFVSDFGNARIDVFSEDGNPIFFFGGKTRDFAGLKGPTGIVYLNGVIFVADCVTGAIYKFDENGNYLGILCRPKTFSKPEAIKVAGDVLFLSDKNQIYSVDYQTGAVLVRANMGSAPSQVTSAVPDVNGNLLVSDFHANEICVMTKLNELVGGLFVQIERVAPENFPLVTLEIKVESRNREGIVGLKDVNFLITENKIPVSEVKFEGAASFNDVADITFLVDRSEKSALFSSALENAIQEISLSMGKKGSVKIVSAGEIPVSEFSGLPSNLIKFEEKSLKTPLAKNCPIDLAIRLCANSLINAEKKRAIVYLTSGDVTPFAFDRYSLSDLAAYLNNNSIAFVVVSLENRPLCSELEYLCANTNGESYYVYRSEGLSSIIKDILEISQGMYRISYKSALQTDFGRAYLPVEAEVYLQNRSGRDETGYFAPLE